MKKLTHKENGWIGTEDGKYAFDITENGITIAVKRALATEYEQVTIYDLDVLKEAVKLYEAVLNAKQGCGKLFGQENDVGMTKCQGRTLCKECIN